MNKFRQFRPDRVTDKIMNKKVDLSVDYRVDSKVYENFDDMNTKFDEFKEGDIIYKDGKFGVWMDGEINEFEDGRGLSGKMALSLIDNFLETFEELDGDEIIKAKAYITTSRIRGEFTARYNNYIAHVPFVLDEEGIVRQYIIHIDYDVNDKYSEEKFLDFLERKEMIPEDNDERDLREKSSIEDSYKKDNGYRFTRRELASLGKLDMMNIDMNDIEWEDLLKMAEGEKLYLVENDKSETLKLENKNLKEVVEEAKENNMEEELVEEVNEQLPHYIKAYPILEDKQKEYLEKYKETVEFFLDIDFDGIEK